MAECGRTWLDEEIDLLLQEWSEGTIQVQLCGAVCNTVPFRKIAEELRQDTIALSMRENKADDQWTVATTKLLENIFAYGMKAITDTLPRNSNLCLWKKIQSDHCLICSSDSIQHHQTQLHVLNNCPTALKQGRYNVRHNKVLLTLFHHLQANVLSLFCVTADLDGTDYRIPQYLLIDLRPNIIVWNDHQIHIFELTVCWEGNFQDIAIRKEAKYLHLLEVVR